MSQRKAQTGRNGYLTPTECAKRLNIAAVTLRKWAQQGMLEAVVTPGGHRRYALEAVTEFAEKYNMPFERNLDENPRILIVDDDPQICNYLTSFFARFNEFVLTEQARDGFEAGLKINNFQPNMILLDLLMPGIDGYEVCKLIKSTPATRHIRVIAMTGFYTEENVERILKAGAEKCLAKPIDKNEILEVVGLHKYLQLSP